MDAEKNGPLNFVYFVQVYCGVSEMSNLLHVSSLAINVIKFTYCLCICVTHSSVNSTL